MKIYHLHRTQHLPISQDIAWAFLSNPANLMQLSPPWANMADESPEHHKTLFPGMLQILRIGLLGVIPCHWIAEITHVQAPHYFVDEQKAGPFAFWHHRHSIQPVTGGVQIEDSVHYAIPMGIFGILAHHLFVKKQLDSLFDYRAQMLDEFFGEG